MTAEQAKFFEQLNHLQEKLTDSWMTYWQRYSSLDTWQFWLLLFMLLAPLIVLFFFIDRSKILQIGFYGFGIHVWMSKLDESAIAFGMWNYRYLMIPFLTASFALDAAFTPVAFMLLYQWTLNRNKNYYLYATGLCLFLAFLFRPSLATFGIIYVKKTSYYFILFLFDAAAMLISKWTTDIFLYLGSKRSKDAQEQAAAEPKVIKKLLLSRMFFLKRKAR
jgi:hypothetical protein